MRFKVDENLPVEVAEALRQAGYDALTIHDQHLVGHSDSQLATICQSEQRAILTVDLGFADIRTYPPQSYSGIVVLRPRVQTKSAALNLIRQLILLLKSETLPGNLWILEENRLRIRQG